MLVHAFTLRQTIRLKDTKGHRAIEGPSTTIETYTTHSIMLVRHSWSLQVHSVLSPQHSVISANTTVICRTYKTKSAWHRHQASPLVGRNANNTHIHVDFLTMLRLLTLNLANCAHDMNADQVAWWPQLALHRTYSKPSWTRSPETCAGQKRLIQTYSNSA